MISLDMCGVSCNAANVLFSKIYDLKKTKDVNVEIFNIITKKINEAKTMVKHI